MRRINRMECKSSISNPRCSRLCQKIIRTFHRSATCLIILNKLKWAQLEARSSPALYHSCSHSRLEESECQFSRRRLKVTKAKEGAFHEMLMSPAQKIIETFTATKGKMWPGKPRKRIPPIIHQIPIMDPITRLP